VGILRINVFWPMSLDSKKEFVSRNPKENGGWIAGCDFILTTGVFVPLVFQMGNQTCEKRYESGEIRQLG